MFARSNHRRGDNLICGEHSGGHGGVSLIIMPRSRRALFRPLWAAAKVNLGCPLEETNSCSPSEIGGVHGFSSSFTRRALKSPSAERTAPGAVPPASERRASADSSARAVLNSRVNAGENSCNRASGISRMDSSSFSAARRTFPATSCASRNGTSKSDENNRQVRWRRGLDPALLREDALHGIAWRRARRPRFGSVAST